MNVHARKCHLLRKVVTSLPEAHQSRGNGARSVPGRSNGHPNDSESVRTCDGRDLAGGGHLSQKIHEAFRRPELPADRASREHRRVQIDIKLRRVCEQASEHVETDLIALQYVTAHDESRIACAIQV